VFDLFYYQWRFFIPLIGKFYQVDKVLKWQNKKYSLWIVHDNGGDTFSVDLRAERSGKNGELDDGAQIVISFS